MRLRDVLRRLAQFTGPDTGHRGGSAWWHPVGVSWELNLEGKGKGSEAGLGMGILSGGAKGAAVRTFQTTKREDPYLLKLTFKMSELLTELDSGGPRSTQP